MNRLEQCVEVLLGYAIDWAATGTWAQLVAAILALMVANKISRAELNAQRAVARDAERQFVALVLGLARQAASDIDDAASALQDRAMWSKVRGGDGPDVPNTAINVMSLRELDLNRMLSAEMGLAVVELRRLSGWGKTNDRQARESWSDNGDLDDDMVEALSGWAASARNALRKLEIEASKLSQTVD